MSSTPPTSPTCCRPQHLDRERLRRLLATDDFTRVAFHEAVVVVGDGGDTRFQLLAVTRDALLLFPLGSGGGATSTSTSPTTTDSVVTRVPLRDVVAVERASPTQLKLRGVMIFATSELFQIISILSTTSTTTTEIAAAKATKPLAPRVLSVATFEPLSRVFFHVSRAFHVDFQRRILDPQVDTETESAATSGELSDLLEELMGELALQPHDVAARCRLLNELAVAVATCESTLQTLCFHDQSAVPSSVTSGNSASATGDYGLVAFVVNELLRLSPSVVENEDRSTEPGEDEQLLEYRLSLLQLLHRLLFGGHYVAARLRVFLHTPLATWLRIATAIPAAASRPHKTDQWRVLVEDLVDAQAALVLELQLLQEEAQLLEDTTYYQHNPTVAQLLMQDNSDRDPVQWLAKLLKRVAVLLSRTPKELLATATSNTSGSAWSLALWRGVSVLMAALRSATGGSSSSSHVAALARRRRDYIDLYLRNPRFGSALASCSVPHLVDVADNLLELLDLVG